MRAGMRFVRERGVSPSAKTKVPGIDVKLSVARFKEGPQGSACEGI